MPTFKRILVPVDGSATAKTALATALELARESGATVRLTHCLDELPYLSGYEYSGVYLDQARQGAERVLCDALALCQAAGVKADTRLVAQSAQRLGETVSDEARDWRADLVVVGTHGWHGPCPAGQRRRADHPARQRAGAHGPRPRQGQLNGPPGRCPAVRHGRRPDAGGLQTVLQGRHLGLLCAGQTTDVAAFQQAAGELGARVAVLASDPNAPRHGRRWERRRRWRRRTAG
jgi:nucleotide-binding universal stress UspA family protein